jgi:hypothetical protein
MWWCYNSKGCVAFFVFEKNKMVMIASITFFDGFATKKGDNNYLSFFQ